MQNKIILGDCLKVMKDFSRESVDLIVTDSPYGDNVAYGHLNKKIVNNENPLINCLALVDCYKILKRNKSLYLFTNWKHYPFLSEFILRYTKFRIKHLLVWKKHNFGMGYSFRHQYEMIMVLEKGKPKYALRNFSDAQEPKFINHTKDSHPHQKPVDLIRKIIKHSSKEGDLVFDPFCGSGSICKAAQLENRKWIGIEKEKRYVKMARGKLSRS
jgi:site-specific DNA-methyltransferase (adenine-specific)